MRRGGCPRVTTAPRACQAAAEQETGHKRLQTTQALQKAGKTQAHKSRGTLKTQSRGTDTHKA
jgi:hypothetical protein